MKLTKSLVKKGGKKSLKKSLKIRKSKKSVKKGGKKSLNTKKARKTRKMKGGTAYDCSGKGETTVSRDSPDGKSQQDRLNDQVTERASKEGKEPVEEENIVLEHQEGDYDKSIHYYRKANVPAFTDKEKEKRRMRCYIPSNQEEFMKMK